jgi:hypothetical protein
MARLHGSKPGEIHGSQVGFAKPHPANPVTTRHAGKRSVNVHTAPDDSTGELRRAGYFKTPRGGKRSTPTAPQNVFDPTGASLAATTQAALYNASGGNV